MPKDYIVLNKDDIMFLNDDEEVRCVTKSGETIHIVTENGYNSIVNAVSKEDWKKAIDYLNMLIAEYVCNGWAGGFYLNAVIIPLKKRYDQGERTKDLYDFIMSCK